MNESVDCMSLISSYIGDGLFSSLSKDKSEKSSPQSGTSATKSLNQNEFENRLFTETSSVNATGRNSFSTSKATNSHAAKSMRSTNPFDFGEDSKNPFDEN